MSSLFRNATLALTAAGALALPAAAGTTETTAPDLTAPAETGHLSAYDRIWSKFTLYKDDNNPYLQEFSFQGRLQLQGAWGDSDRGSYGSDDRPNINRWGDDVEVRRWRLGFKSKFFRTWKFEGQIDVNPDWDPFYKNIYDLYLTYAPSEAVNVTVGKFKANNFGIEQFTSSKEILTMERGLLSNLLFAGELTGVRFSGKKGNWIYAASLTSGTLDQEFDDFSGGTFVQASIGYDLHEKLGLEKALVKLDWQHSSDSTNSAVADDRFGSYSGGAYENAFSLNSHFEQGKWGLYTDFLAADGYTAGDVWGVIITPSYYLTDGLQLVMRYQYANGDNDGLRLQSRYERLAPAYNAVTAPDGLRDGGRGENYHALYLGLNYYLYGHKLKLMGGVEYHTMDNGNDSGGEFDGWTATAGVRMFF
jgi:phosphate-selective porin OprO and OprP